MRLDKFLKVSRIFKRRTIAKEVSKNQKIQVNDRSAKPSTDIKVGDIIDIHYGAKKLKIKVTAITSYAKKEYAENLYQILSDSKLN